MEFLDRNKQKIKAIIELKNKEDPVGFSAAERSGNLSKFLENDLKKAGISVDSFMATMGQQQKSSSSSSSSRSTGGGGAAARSNNVGSNNPNSENPDVQQVVITISNALDEHIFKQLYTDTPNPHKYFAEALAATKSPKILKTLNNFKVICAVSSLFFFGLAAKNLATKNIFKVLVYGMLGFDLCKMSYNCYMKKYCTNALHHLFGDTLTTGATIFASVKAAVGLADPASDPLIKLKHGIMFEVIYDTTLTKQLYDKLKSSMSA